MIVVGQFIGPVSILMGRSPKAKTSSHSMSYYYSHLIMHGLQIYKACLAAIPYESIRKWYLMEREREKKKSKSDAGISAISPTNLCVYFTNKLHPNNPINCAQNEIRKVTVAQTTLPRQKACSRMNEDWSRHNNNSNNNNNWKIHKHLKLTAIWS